MILPDFVGGKSGPDVVGDRFSHGVLLLGFVKAWVVWGLTLLDMAFA